MESTAQNILCFVQKENKRTEELDVKGIVLYEYTCGTIQDGVLIGNIRGNSRPYFGPMEPEDMINYAHSDFGYSRGYETEFTVDATPKDIEENILQYLRYKLLEDPDRDIENLYIPPKYLYLKEQI